MKSIERMRALIKLAEDTPAPAFKPWSEGVDTRGLPSPKPCPFCGNEGTRHPIYLSVRSDCEGRLRYDVDCGRCHCTGPGAGEFSAICAAARWNVRGHRCWITAAAEAGDIPSGPIH